MPRFNYNKSATIKRLGSYSGGKSTYSAVAGTIPGYFTPTSNSQTGLSLGIIGQAYEFHTDSQKDIKVNDILTIDSVDYGVQGISVFDLGGIRFRKCILQLIVTE
jgi:hypothetical protein